MPQSPLPETSNKKIEGILVEMQAGIGEAERRASRWLMATYVLFSAFVASLVMIAVGIVRDGSASWCLGGIAAVMLMGVAVRVAGTRFQYWSLVVEARTDEVIWRVLAAAETDEAERPDHSSDETV